MAFQGQSWGMKIVPRYLGKSMAKEDSSRRPVGLSSFEKGSIDQRSVPSKSHGFGLSCCTSKEYTHERLSCAGREGGMVL